MVNVHGFLWWKIWRDVFVELREKITAKKICPKCGHYEDDHQLVYHSQKYYCNEIGCDCDIDRKDMATQSKANQNKTETFK